MRFFFHHYSAPVQWESPQRDHNTYHEHHRIVNVSREEVPVLSEPLEGGVRVPEASSQLLLFGFHHAVHVIQLCLQHWNKK